MTRRNITDLIKNAVGTVFLLAGAFFVCSTLVSMRAVFADPIAPTVTAAATSASPRATASPRAGASRTTTARPNNAASRATAARPSVANGTINTATTTSRGVASRTNTARTATARPTANTAAASRAATSTTSRGTATRSGTATRTGATTTSRGVTSRTGTTTARVAANNAGRTVAARSGTAAGASRVSLQGTAIRGSTSATSNKYTYLQNKLYTGNYSNIIDSTTGLISTEAYNNCMESYYACMDEICTARNQAQRRCACAGRVKAFANAESQLETANEELIKVSGELALLVATKGKDISAALQLTDAEKVMNCVSWQETINQYGASSDKAKDWCTSHGIFAESGGKVTSCTKPSYCSAGGNDFGFDIKDIEGSSSDILASLQSWASAKENTLTILDNDNNKLSNAFSELNNVMNGMAGLNTTLSTDSDLTDSLSNTWGYELFEYAHNNVCNRVLDSCFNGIYEACGTPTGSSKQRKCGNGQNQCPFNYSSYIAVDKTNGEYTLDFITDNSSYSHNVSNSATCFGYTSASGDPYNNLRGPVADARRSIMQKYALDANADCDVYGEQLRKTAQNIGYQKVAAQQALQQKRLEFAMEEDEANETALVNAKQNYLQCLDEIQNCRNDIDRQYRNQGWTTTRIKSYCNTMSNVPTCYEQMVCEQSATSIITAEDVANEKTKTLVQNTVTLSDILTLGADNNDKTSRAACLANDMNVKEIRSFGTYQDTRETCLPTNGIAGYREYNATDRTWGECNATECKTGYDLTKNESTEVYECKIQEGYQDTPSATQIGPFVPAIGVMCTENYVAQSGKCVPANCPENTDYTQECITADKNYEKEGCVKVGCKCDYGWYVEGNQCSRCAEDEHLQGNKCVSNTETCSDSTGSGEKTWNKVAREWGDCLYATCNSGYHLSGTKCAPDTIACEPRNGILVGTQEWNGTRYGDCVATQCDTSMRYVLQDGKCVQCAENQYVENNKCVDQKEKE